ncbi:hypothetical protein Bca4012_064869 [Brassica carinata]
MTSLIGKKDLACKHFTEVKAPYVALTLSQTAEGVELWRHFLLQCLFATRVWNNLPALQSPPTNVFLQDA